jgi:hypothetical protein
MGTKMSDQATSLEVRPSQGAPVKYPAEAFLVKPREKSYYRCPEYVYVIQWGEDGPVKIGMANSPDQRLADLQCANWMELRLIAVVPFRTGSRLVEKKAHELAAEDRLRGEWFDLHPTDAIECILAAASALGGITVPLNELIKELSAEASAEAAEEHRRARALQRRAMGMDD